MLFDGSATITSSDTTVEVGNLNNGRITLTYDSVTDVIEARFVKRVDSACQTFEVSINDDVNWSGRAQISTCISL